MKFSTKNRNWNFFFLKISNEFFFFENFNWNFFLKISIDLFFWKFQLIFFLKISIDFFFENFNWFFFWKFQLIFFCWKFVFLFVRGNYFLFSSFFLNKKVEIKKSWKFDKNREIFRKTHRDIFFFFARCKIRNFIFEKFSYFVQKLFKKNCFSFLLF